MKVFHSAEPKRLVSDAFHARKMVTKCTIKKLADTNTVSALKAHDSTVDRDNVDGDDAEKSLRRGYEPTLSIVGDGGHSIVSRARQFLKERWSTDFLGRLEHSESEYFSETE